MVYVTASDLHFTYGVVERVHSMLRSDDPPPVPEMRRILAGLCAALASSCKSPRNLPKKSYRSDLQRIRRIAYEMEDMLDVAAAKQTSSSVPNQQSKPRPFQLHHLGSSSDSEELTSIIGKGIQHRPGPSHPDRASTISELERISRIMAVSSGSNEVTSAVGKSTAQKGPAGKVFYASPELMRMLSELEGFSRTMTSATFSNSNEITSSAGGDLLASQKLTDDKDYCSWLRFWEDNIVGRGSEVRQIVDWILLPSDQGQPSIISVFGTAGIGKTSLTRLVYNDVQLSTNFALLSWAFVCGLDIKTVLIEILRSFTHQSWFDLHRMDTQTLKERLCGMLVGQKYLLVLDDVGLEQLTWWVELWDVLKAGSTGSTVVVITVWETVARQISSVHCLELKGLPANDCWSLFTSCSGFSKVEQQKYPLLNRMGASIVNKWHGCTLAIKILGRMLADNRDEHLWKQTEDTEILTAFTPAYDALGISFQNMHCELAQCFISFAILPENKLISREQLVYFWMAHGLLKRNQNPIDIGHRYCNELLSRAFVQLYRSNGHEILQMSHAAHTLAVDLMQKEVVHLPGSLFVEQGPHLLWVGDAISLKKGFAAYSSTLSKVRTFLFKKEVGSVSKICLKELISKLRLVRVLLLDGSEFEELPETIGNLKLLRYLSLAGNQKLRLLPDSLCSLPSLQTLDLSGCEELQTIPKDMPSLRCLFLSLRLTNVPEEALRSWVLLDHLKICNCPNLSSFFFGQNLSSLSWSITCAIRVLHVHYCSLISSLSSYMRGLNYLKELSILNCENLDLQDSMGGLWSLEYLQLQGLPKLSEFPHGLKNAANSLRHVIVSNCENLIGLPDYLHECINLSEMVVDNCPNIVTLPKGICEIQTLQILKVANCPILIARCMSWVGEDWHLISHIPRIQLQHQVIQNRARDEGFSPIPTTVTPSMCKFSGCSKRARDGSGLCIDHASSRCRMMGCNKPADGKSVLCKAHGGLSRCTHEGCSRVAGGMSGLCIHHGGGKRCQTETCNKVAVGVSGFCKEHRRIRRRNSLRSTKGTQEETDSSIAPGCGDPSDVLDFYTQENAAIQKMIECFKDSINSQEDEDLAPKLYTEKMLDYCSILSLLPEKCEMDKETLIQLWIAAGEYIKDEPFMKLHEGEDCFSFILSRGYLLPSGTNFMTGKGTYRINNTKINELLLDSQKDKCISHLKWDNEYQWSSSPTTAESVHHVSLVCNDIGETIYETLLQFNKLRTLLLLGNHVHRVIHVPDHLFLAFENLQVLDLSRAQIRELPSSIGHAIHLRYLDLSWTLIEWLPDTICSLLELQTLKLRGCSNLSELPREMKRLTELRHLDVDVLRQLEVIPRGIGALVNLRTLSAFLVGSDEDGCKIQELKHLNNLFGNLCIAQLEHVGNADEAREATLHKKEHLEKLELRWTASEISGMHSNSDLILECLQPSTSLEELRILCYEGSTFPCWISNPEYDRLVCLNFYKCENLLELPQIEQLPSLRHLGLTKMNGIQTIKRRCGLVREDVAFPKLEKLEIHEMQSLNVWDWKKMNEGDFISLTELIINDCSELEVFDVLPHLSSIKNFEIRECPKLESLSDVKLPNSLEELIVEDCPLIQKKCLEHEGVDWYKIKDVPTITIQEVDEDGDEECITGTSY